MGNVYKVGDVLLDYGKSLGEVSEGLREALTILEKSVEKIEEETIDGRSLPELEQFYGSLSLNVSKLCNFYDKAAQYVFNVYSESYYNEQQLTKWVNSFMK